jgi:hypothetical protein
MRLSANALKNVDSLNAWNVAENWVIRSDGDAGETTSLYFRLVDLDRDGIRYIPDALATMSVTFPALDDLAVITLNATFPFADDRSIMKVDIASTQVPYSGAVKFALTENGTTKSFVVYGFISVEKLNAGMC